MASDASFSAPAPSTSSPSSCNSPGDFRHPVHVVVMGVAGCGKSAAGRLIAGRLGLPLVEGDDFHSPGNIHKMQHGLALTDEDRADWLMILGKQLQSNSRGAVMTCSALKAAYRNSLRLAAPDLRFVYLALTPAQALKRVSGRAGHFYPPSLVTSQFETLQDPSDEAGVLKIDGTNAPQAVVDLAVTWLVKGTI